MNEEIIQKILEEKIIIIVRGLEGEALMQLAEALCEGGIRFMEITYAADKEETDEAVAQTIRTLSERMDGRMYIGAGTVIRKNQVDLTKAAGGKFIISPDADPEIIAHTKQCGLVSIPGALTPGEITAAHRAGADFVKLFPANLHGPSYVKTIKAPLSHIRLLAVGSVDETTMEAYAEAGACGFGIGTKFGDPNLLKNRDFAAITEVAKGYVAIAKSKNGAKA